MIDKVIVGSEEWCSLHELKVPAIKIRVDSGAKTSALQSDQIVTFEKDVENWIRFTVHPIQRNTYGTRQCEARVIDKRIVKSSSGTIASRSVINTVISLGDPT